MKQLNWQTGQKGEVIACDWLLKKGYQILESNFRTRFGEIDLVTTKNKKLIFVEVKLKVGEQFGQPEEMINQAKISQIQKTAAAFLQTHPKIAAKYPFCQIDAICIVLNQDKTPLRINHYENLGYELA